MTRAVLMALFLGGMAACGVAFSEGDTGAGGASTSETTTTSAGGDGGADPIATSTGGGASGPVGGGGGAGGSAPLGPFGAPVPLDVLNTADSEDDPSLTADMLIIFFDSNRNGSGDVWTSSRTSADAPWQPPTLVAALSTSGKETTPEISADGLTIWFSSDRNGADDIFVSTRPTRQSGWATPVPVDAINTSDGEYATFVSSDLTYMMFGSTRPGPGNFDLYVTTRANAAATWAPPLLVAELSTADVETDPWFDATRTHFYFSSDRPGAVGSWDVWYTTRPDVGAPWGTPVNVSELNTTENDGDVWLSPDMRKLVMTRAGDLYEATR